MRPELHILSTSICRGANAEFLSAHERYRKRRQKESLTDRRKAFESCIKAICNVSGWTYTEKDSVRRLIQIVFDKELIQPFVQLHFSALGIWRSLYA